MTCVAYKDGVMAADTMCVSNGSIKRLNEVKVAKSRRHLIGMSGDALPSIEECVNWYFTKKKVALKGYEFTLLVVEPSGAIHQCDSSGRVDHIKEPFFAIGSGREFAFGAMECGATAEQAVQAAIRWCDSVGGKVIVRKL